MYEELGCSLIRGLKNEMVTALIARVQADPPGKRTHVDEPEVKSPKVICEVEEMLNNPFMNRDEVPLAMDIFKPVLPEEQELPVIIVIHGGGLVMFNRTSSRRYAKSLASRGYLVFSLEYRLAPRANTCQQLDDVCAGMDLVGQRLVDFNVDFTRIFLSAGSAGAYLATYVAAMKKSKAMQDAIGYKPTHMVFKALGLHCGMFYTDRPDPIGFLLEDQLYGSKTDDENFRPFLDPENPEIINNLPPVFLTTSRGDFLNNYSVMFHEALKKAGHRSKLIYYGDDDLFHAFVTIKPYLASSIDAIDKMVDWFEEQAKRYHEDQERHQREEEALRRVNERIESGEIIEQKSWAFIRELNSYSREALSRIALTDENREYSYREMFRMWKRYARVFSALDITEKSNARVMMKGTSCIEIISAFYALNMTGASVSTTRDQTDDPSKITELAKREKITDLILPDIHLSVRYLKKLKNMQESLGFRNIIVIHIPVAGEDADSCEERENMRKYRALKKVKGVLFFDDLLKQYETAPIFYGKTPNDMAYILHTSGTTTGKRKSVPVSDRGLNEAARRMFLDPELARLRNKVSCCLLLELSIAYSVFDMLHLPLAFGGKVTVSPDVSMLGPETVMLLLRNRPNIIFALPPMLKRIVSAGVHLDLSFLEFIFVGGGYFSAESKKQFDDFLKECGADTRVTIGYGNSESGGAVILSRRDREDDSIGYPLPNIKIRLYDEEKDIFLNPEEGPCRGVLHICSPSVSSGRIDDTVLFELTEIEGEKYLNTYDLVEVREDGAYFFVGRMNKFFINNEGIRFDAGLVERAISAQPGIEGCGIVPRFSRRIRDTVPSLYVKTNAEVKNPVKTVKKALLTAFSDEDLVGRSSLPFDVTIAEEIPYNDGGKVDIYQITTGKVKGKQYGVVPVKEGGVLKEIRLEPFNIRMSDAKAMPEELKKYDDR